MYIQIYFLTHIKKYNLWVKKMFIKKMNQNLRI